MSLATLWSIPRNDDLIAQFGFSNSRHHEDIADVIGRQRGILIPRWPLDPVPLADMRGWLQNHQIIHTTQNGILGIEGTDLSDVNMRDEEQFAAWVFLHAKEHMQAAQILRIN